MKTNADDKDHRDEAPIRELKARPGRMTKFAQTEIEKVKKSLNDLQHEEFGSPKYLEALNYIWDNYFTVVADSRAEFCKRLALDPVVAKKLIGDYRNRDAGMPGTDQKESINTGDHPENPLSGLSDSEIPKPTVTGSVESAAQDSIIPKADTALPHDRDADGAPVAAPAILVVDTEKPTKQRGGTKSKGSDVSTALVKHDVESSGPLAPGEAERFLQCEEKIRVNVKSLFELGEALQEIRDKKLYRQWFKSFEEYCRCRWDFSRVWACYQIQAASVMQNLLTVVTDEDLPEPVNERQIRPLAGLEPDQQCAAWKRACKLAGESEVNHHHVEQAVKELKGDSDGPAEHPKSSKDKSNEAPTQATPDDQNSARPQSFPPSGGEQPKHQHGDDTMSGINAGSKPCKFSFDSVAELDADECLELWVQLLDTIQRTALQSEPAKHESESKRTLDEPGIQRAARRAMDATRSTANKRRKYEQPMFWRKVIQALAIEVKMEFLGCFAKPSQRGDSNPESKVRGEV